MVAGVSLEQLSSISGTLSLTTRDSNALDGREMGMGDPAVILPGMIIQLPVFRKS